MLPRWDVFDGAAWVPDLPLYVCHGAVRLASLEHEEEEGVFGESTPSAAEKDLGTIRNRPNTMSSTYTAP